VKDTVDELKSFSVKVTMIGGNVCGLGRIKLGPLIPGKSKTFNGKNPWSVINSITSWMHTEEAEYLQNLRMEKDKKQ
jgi:hypothetical protein